MSKRIVESLYRVCGVKLNEMVLEEMPTIDASRNDSIDHQIQKIKDLYKNIQYILWDDDETLVGIKSSDEEPSNAVRTVYTIIKRNLILDIKNNARHWASNDANIFTIIETYNNMLKDLNKYINANYSRRHIKEAKDKWLYPLQRLLVDLEKNSYNQNRLYTV